MTGRIRLNTTVTRNAKEVFDLLHDDLAAIEREFGRDTVSSVRAITEIGEYLRAGGGKRLRPALLLLSCKLMRLYRSGRNQAGARWSKSSIPRRSSTTTSLMKPKRGAVGLRPTRKGQLQVCPRR